MKGRRAITEVEAGQIIHNNSIVRVAAAHPACVEFALGDGRRLILWDAGYECDRHWEIADRSLPW